MPEHQREQWLDDSLGTCFDLAVETQVRGVELEGGAGAWKQFGLIRSCS
jgi:hypothetical protein